MIDASIGILVSGKKFLMLQRSSDDDFSPNTWSFPGGKADKGEVPLETITREFMEETGLLVQVHRELETATSDEFRITVFSVYSIAGDLKEFPDSEHQSYKWFSVEDEMPPVAGTLTEKWFKKTQEALKLLCD